MTIELKSVFLSLIQAILCDDVSEHVEEVDDEGTVFADSSSRKGTFSTMISCCSTLVIECLKRTLQNLCPKPLSCFW